MKKSDKRVIVVLSFVSTSLSPAGLLAEFVPEENPSGRYTSEPILRVKYRADGQLREAESAGTVYRLKPRGRGRPRRSE